MMKQLRVKAVRHMQQQHLHSQLARLLVNPQVSLEAVMTLHLPPLLHLLQLAKPQDYSLAVMMKLPLHLIRIL